MPERNPNTNDSYMFLNVSFYKSFLAIQNGIEMLTRMIEEELKLHFNLYLLIKKIIFFSISLIVNIMFSKFCVD